MLLQALGDRNFEECGVHGTAYEFVGARRVGFSIGQAISNSR
ncbi:MAG: hypothetical protein QOK17_448 [Sphingomonadales bacterium]|jgi:hypothetical protein|nr:hypothetical protein [Sphingomonadales bacterium]